MANAAKGVIAKCINHPAVGSETAAAAADNPFKLLPERHKLGYLGCDLFNMARSDLICRLAIALRMIGQIEQ